MTSLATAFVDVRPDMTGFDSRLSAGATTASSSAGSKAGKSFMSRFGGALKIGATLTGAFAVTKGIQFLGDTIAQAREAQKATAQTAAVIKSTGGVAKVSARDVSELANAISLKTGIDDEEIQASENMLLTFKNVHNEVGKGNDIFNQATQTVTDMSAALGQDAKNSAIQLGKALNDPIKGITALSRVGVTFDDQQKNTITHLTETGHRLQAQKIILKELTSEFGGSAAAQATAGDKMKVAWENLKEEIGTKLLPILDKLETWLTNKVIPKVAKFIHQMGNGKGPGGDFAAVLGDIWDAGKKAAGVIGDVVGFLKDMPSWAVKGAVGGVLGALAFGKFRSIRSGGGGGALGGLISSAKPVPVFVTNPGFGGAGGAGGVGGLGKKGIPGKLPGAGALLPFALPALGSQVIKPGEPGGQIKLPTNLKAINEELARFAQYRTGVTDLVGSFKALDGILATTVKRDPSAGWTRLQLLSKQTGVSMKNLKTILPLTGREIDRLGLGTQTAAQKTQAWLNTIIGTGKAVDATGGKVDYYGTQLKKMPKSVMTKVLAPGAVTTAGQVQDLYMKYKLTPKQVLTIMRAQDFAHGTIVAVMRSLAIYGHQKPTAKLLADANPAHMNVNSARYWLEQYGKMHPTATLDANTAPARAAISAINQMLVSLTRPRSVYVGVSGPGATGARNVGQLVGAHRAAGGPVMRGRSYLVGERGPEVLTMGGNGYVTPNSRLRRGGGGRGAGGVVALDDGDIDRLAAAVYQGTRDGIAARGATAYASRRVGR